ncbi:MAG: hypothetical protein NTW19_09815 [Planctomycetota bacterium]|nr:hypothetical protein [Planctomycetota bacterium]
MFTTARLLAVVFASALAAAPAMAWDRDDRRDDHRDNWDRHDRREVVVRDRHDDRYDRRDDRHDDRFRHDGGRVGFGVQIYSAPTIVRSVQSCETVVVAPPPVCAPVCAPVCEPVCEPAAQVFYTAPPTCAPQQTVVYQPAPQVIYQPAPRVVYRPAPVVYCPPPQPSFNINFGFRIGR